MPVLPLVKLPAGRAVQVRVPVPFGRAAARVHCVLNAPPDGMTLDDRGAALRVDDHFKTFSRRGAKASEPEMILHFEHEQFARKTVTQEL